MKVLSLLFFLGMMMSMTLSQWTTDEFGDCQLFPGNRREEVMRLKHFCPTCQTDADAIARSVLVFTLESLFENDFKFLFRGTNYANGAKDGGTECQLGSGVVKQVGKIRFFERICGASL